MTLRRTKLIPLALCLLPALAAAAPEVDRIAFGSCLRQADPQPVWDAVLAAEPDLFVFAGDNVYADMGLRRFAPEPDRISWAYDELAEQPGFRALRERVPVLATWDDHDYGLDDAGAEYPHKQASQKLFLDFFGVPEDAPQRHRPGVYSARTFGEPGRRVQVILLDTRYFRGEPLRTPPDAGCPMGGYRPNEDPAAGILGEEQWAWLAERLAEPAEVRILVSSIQVISDRHCFEKWANFPRERERLFRLIRESRADGVVLVSGDRHLAEISRLPPEVIGYPLYEVTSSGLNSAFSTAGDGEENPYRTTDRPFRRDNFGLIRIDWGGRDPLLILEVRDETGRTALSQPVELGRLRAP